MKRLLAPVLSPVRRLLEAWRLPRGARLERRRDRREGPGEDPGPEQVMEAGLTWLCRGQDRSATADGGVARHFSLVDGWSPSYPETTGYIVPTFLAAARRTGNEEFRRRARRMLDWLVSLQMPSGAFPGGMVGQEPVRPVTFNTGQILLGLAAGTAELDEAYREPMRRAADWLVETQDPDGAWRSHPTPFAAPGEKSYETHVAWGLLEAAAMDSDRGYAEAALANVAWALGRQRENGWFVDCCLTDPSRPLTHTLGYALRGVLEAARFASDGDLLLHARRTADGVLDAMPPDGRLPGRLAADWGPAATWSCLTGTSQLACCWLLLFRETGDRRYLEGARAANAFVRRTVRVDGPPDTRGGVKGSFPVDGAYGRFELLSWACKFTVDANALERASPPNGATDSSDRKRWETS